MSVAPAKALRTFALNGEGVQCAFAPNKTLLEVLREDLGLTGTKHGCEMGHCGACCVLIDDRPVLACLVLAIEVNDRPIRTVEGLAKDGRLHPVQEAFAQCGAAQCGYCTPGFLMTAAAIVEQNNRLGEADIRAAIAGNLCRCTGYTKIIEAIALASDRMHEAQPGG
ncbi:MAG: (2Fe-2S)-binding protein [Candidatus Eremiobacteraeota bacterium]|nr:(2Fe-2S)-binding protein [Candidatus Eremiobacteraeota bacterium]MBC5827079.1 (2Fe-2S)-binding protein [Candidatus Eremiobacteraeota bacterium]